MQTTILNVIGKLDTLKPNTYSQEYKIKWLSELDEIVKKEIIDTHTDGETVNFSGYDEKTLLTTELLIPSPYDEVYLYWLASRIDFWNGETMKFNNSNAMFDAAFENYAKYYNSQHKPLRKLRGFLF